MAAYELKYTAEEIDGILESVDKKTIYGDATQLEHGLMSTTDKAKLDSLPTSQQINTSLSGKVDKVDGKGLSTNNYDNTAKTKVDAIPEDPKYTDTVYDDTALAGRVSTIEGKESGWDAKQDTLVSGTNIKTVNGESLLGSGNIEIQGGGSGEENVIEAITMNGDSVPVTNKTAAITETDPTVPSWAKQSAKPAYDYSEIGNTPDIPTVPGISTNISTDALSDTKTASPKAVKTYVDNKVSTVYKAAGSVNSVAGLGFLIENNLGNVYNMTNAFTTTSDFLEGAGIEYPAGTNVAIVRIPTGKLTFDYKYDVLAGLVDLSGKMNIIDDGIADNIPAIGSNGNLYDSGVFIDDVLFRDDSAVEGNIPVYDGKGYIYDSGHAPSDFATASQGAKADTAYQKPAGGIPASDLASGVIPAIPDVSGKEDTSNKVTSLSSSSTNIQYPGAKCVFDALGKWGVVRQTQTWSGTGTQPRTYVMSDLVYGTIPQANIDLFESAGATFNAATGYFELNGLTDISYEEMKVIYSLPHLTPVASAWSPLYSNISVNARTIIPMRTNSAVTSLGTANILSMFLNSSAFETIVFNISSDGLNRNSISAQSCNYAFNGCQRLRDIDELVVTDSVNNQAFYSAFNKCYSLENIRLRRLGKDVSFEHSSLLNLSSIVYMVENAINTTAITITLHADAYARCQADTTEYTYGGNTYTGILALATAHNITIASA